MLASAYTCSRAMPMFKDLIVRWHEYQEFRLIASRDFRWIALPVDASGE